MQSDPAVVREDLKETKLPFDIVCDTDMNIYKSLEIAPAASMEAMLGGDPSVMAKLQEKGAKAEAAGFTHGKYEGDEQQLPAMFLSLIHIYTLSEKGESVVPILQSICRWSGVFYKEDPGKVLPECRKCDFTR